MATGAGTYPVDLGFLPRELSTPDPDRPGLLRAGDRAAAPYGDGRVELHRCSATDLAAEDAPPLDLLGAGVDVVDLTPVDELQQVLARVRDRGEIGDEDAEAIRSHLDGSLLSTAGGLTLRVLHLAGEGLFMRTAGPDGLPLGREIEGRNGHGAAASVHADQDVFGTPLRQLMDGRAPELFRYDSPDGRHRDAELMLVNIWIPLQQITQPLVLADGRSIDRPGQQLRFGLRTESFLDRDDDMAVNDIWLFHHDPDQRWYFRSEMDHRSAYVFDTLSTPHGAGVLPGEDLAARCGSMLASVERAVVDGDVDGVRSALAELGAVDVPSTTPALRRAIGAMAALADEARADPAAVCGEAASSWLERSRAARRAVVRMSLELRLVVSVEAKAE